MQAAGIKVLQTIGTVYQYSWSCISEDSNVYQQCLENIYYVIVKLMVNSSSGGGGGDLLLCPICSTENVVETVLWS